MTALTELQQKWAMNTEKKEITGILLWDLSAAFDCLDSEILCKKLEIYEAFQERRVAARNKTGWSLLH